MRTVVCFEDSCAILRHVCREPIYMRRVIRKTFCERADAAGFGEVETGGVVGYVKVDEGEHEVVAAARVEVDGGLVNKGWKKVRLLERLDSEGEEAYKRH